MSSTLLCKSVLIKSTIGTWGNYSDAAIELESIQTSNAICDP